jgi:hypothetical protein
MHPGQQGQPGPYQGLPGPNPQPQPQLQQAAQQLLAQGRAFVLLAVFTFVPGVVLASGGLHYGFATGPAGFVYGVGGLIALAVAVRAFLRVRRIRAQLRPLLPQAQPSPVAHLPVARQAARLAAWINGVLVLLSLAIAVGLFLLGGGAGVWSRSFAFGGLMLGVMVPLGFAALALSSIAEIRRGVPGGARTGQKAFSVLLGLSAVAAFGGIRAGTTGPVIVFGAVALVCVAAVYALGRCAGRMAGEAAQ